MLFAVNFCRNVALLLLISPGITITAGPRLLRFMYSTGLYIAWSEDALARCDVSLPAVGDGLPNVGGAKAAALASAKATPSSGGTHGIEKRRFIVMLLLRGHSRIADRESLRDRVTFAARRSGSSRRTASRRPRPRVRR